MNMLHDRTQRIISIMKEENLNATQFAEAIGIQRAAMSHIMGGRNNPSIDVIAKIIERFETINPAWLLSGKGSMRITPNNANGGSISDSRNALNTKSGNESIKFSSYITDGSEPDLFHQNDTRTPAGNPLHEEDIRTEIYFTDQKQEGAKVNIPESVDKIPEKEIIIYKDKPSKEINKLLIFYSDNTFETFIPEKSH